MGRTRSFDYKEVSLANVQKTVTAPLATDDETHVGFYDDLRPHFLIADMLPERYKVRSTAWRLPDGETRCGYRWTKLAPLAQEDVMLWTYWLAAALGLVVVYFFAGVRVVRPTGRGLVERLGKYRRLAMPGFNWIVPFVDRLFLVNVTEVMVNAERQEIITSDKLNARVDAQVYFKVKSDEGSVKSSQYAVFDYQYQIVNLARTTLRNIIGTLTLKSANSERGKINSELQRTLREETTHWGIEIVRAELKEIDPPEDVQVTMNKVVKAENEKVAAVDFATATETMADGARRAEIKKAEGIKQAKILEAEGEAQAIQLVNEAADKYFVGNAQLLRRLIAMETSLSANTKIVVPADAELVNIVGDMAGVLPLIRSSAAGKSRKSVPAATDRSLPPV
jgi:regulator of protease activity HflC (stomatin/prohibitin superfamily)